MNIDSMFFVVSAALNIPLSAIAIVGNALVLISIARTPSLISPSNVLLLGLAFTDFCIGLVAQPLFTGKNINMLASLQVYVSNFLCVASFVNITFLSVDMFLALYLHLRYKELVTIKRTVFVLGNSWVWCAICISSRKWLQRYLYVLFGGANACLAHVVNVVLYYKIYRIVRRHQHQIHCQAQVQSNYKTAIITRLKRSFINTFYVYLLFIASSSPYMVMTMLRSKLPSSVFNSSLTFIYLNSYFHPLLISWRIQGIRAAIKDTLKRANQQLLCRKQSHNSLNSSGVPTQEMTATKRHFRAV